MVESHTICLQCVPCVVSQKKEKDVSIDEQIKDFNESLRALVGQQLEGDVRIDALLQALDSKMDMEDASEMEKALKGRMLTCAHPLPHPTHHPHPTTVPHPLAQRRPASATIPHPFAKQRPRPSFPK